MPCCYPQKKRRRSSRRRRRRRRRRRSRRRRNPFCKPQARIKKMNGNAKYQQKEKNEIFVIF